MSLSRMASRALILALLVCPSLAFAEGAGEDAPAEAKNMADEQDKSQKSDWQLRPRWRVQFDTVNIEGPTGLAGTGKFSGMRRAQLGVDLKMPGGFSARVEGEFTTDPIQFIDAYIAWDRDGVNVTAGQQKIFLSLDDMTSDTNISFMERPSFLGAYNATRRLGLSASYVRDDFVANAGLFTEPLIALNDVPDNSLGLDMRAAWTPPVGKTRFHLGGSLHLRDRNDMATLPQRYRRRAMTNITTVRFVATPSMTVEREMSYGIEAAAVHGRLHFAGEAHWLRSDRPAALSDPQFFGGYMEAGFFLTNDTRPLAAGLFGAIKPSRPLGAGGIGAVQVNLRYDYLDLNDAGITGGTQNGYLASLIWTPTENFRLMGQYVRLNYRDAAIAVAGNRDYGLNVWGLRGQLSF